MTRSRLLALLFLLAGILGQVPSVAAHPHVFVRARAEVVYDDKGQIVAINHDWQFDDAFSAFALQGLDTNGDGKYSREELAELAKINIDSMKEYGYFTFGDDTRVEIDFNAPLAGYWLETKTVPFDSYWAISDDDRKAIAEDKARGVNDDIPTEVTLLELHFTLPLKEPVGHDKPVTFDVYDPTYYVDFRFADGNNVITFKNAPGACRVKTKAPAPLDDQTAAALAQIGADVRQPPPELMEVTQNLVNQMIITCGDATAAASTGGETPSGPTGSPLDAVNALAAKGDEVVKEVATTRITATPQTTGEATAPKDPEAAKSATSISWLSRLLGKVSQMQSAYYQEMISALRLFRTNDRAAWLLIWLSFAYGIFHAAGPGHGKAVITSYMFANEATVKRGVALSFGAAFVQGLTAVAIVSIIALVLKGTSIAMTSTLGVFESSSFALVALLGAWLTWTKGRAFLRLVMPRAARGHDHHHGHDHAHAHHDHDHTHGDAYPDHPDPHHVHGPDCGCGHNHLPDADLASRKLSLREALAAIFSIGLRPCSGALVVLVFALSLDLYWVGVASAFVMAFGTALTVSSLAIIAMTSKGLAQRFLGGEGTGRARLLTAGLEAAAAVFVLFVGLVLFVASFGATTVI